MFEVHDLCFSYQIGGRSIEILKNLNLTVSSGEFVGIQGPSGSGKSTLFYVLGFLLKATSGRIVFDGQDITSLSQDRLTLLRNEKIGFIFQQFHLLSNSTCLQNILLPTLYPVEVQVGRRTSPEEYRKKAIELATRLGLGEHLNHFPNQLSGGQQQRVAIARALIHDVDLILADEPTGNLDSKTAREIMGLLQELHRQGKTIILITHDSEIAKCCSRVCQFRDGRFIEGHEKSEAKGSRGEECCVGFKVGFEQRIQKLDKESTANIELNISNVIGALKNIFPIVIENIFRNKAKSLLTMLGVVIGVAAVLAMVSLGQYAKVKILDSYESVGVNKLLIRGYPNWNLKATDPVTVKFLSFDWDRDLIPLKRIFPEIQMISPVLETGQCNATSGGITISNKVAVFGVNPEYLAITNRSVFAGSNLSPYHVRNASPVCLIGYDIASRLFERRSALGELVTVTDGWRLNFPCRVVGVLASQTSTKDSLPPNMHILVPYTYFKTISPHWWYAQAHEAALKVAPHADVQVTGNKVKAYFQMRYGKSGEFNVDSDSALIAQMKKFLNIFAILLTAIALLSLLVGGIGINNMILVSVTERIKEFGIRKALGATNRSIRIQVLLESITICAAAGVLGVLLGFGTYELLIYGATFLIPSLKFEWIVIPSAIAVSFLSIIAVGVLSGLVPAIRAEKLQIIEALRAD